MISLLKIVIQTFHISQAKFFFVSFVFLFYRSNQRDSKQVKIIRMLDFNIMVKIITTSLFYSGLNASIA